MLNKKNILLNCVPILVLVLCFPLGSNAFFIMLLLLPILAGFNFYASDNRGSLIKYDGIMLISAVLGVLLNSFLYFVLICYDAEGMIVMYAELFTVVLFSLLLSGITLIIQHFREGKKL